MGPSVEGGVILSNYGVDLYNSFCETMKGLLKTRNDLGGDGGGGKWGIIIIRDFVLSRVSV